MNNVEAEQIFSEELYLLPRKVLVLIPKPWESLQPDEILLLNKILGSVKLSLSAVQIVCYAETDLTTLKTFNPSYILSFGTRLIPDSKLFNPETIDGIRIVQSEQLLNLDDAKKKSLWQALKQAFGL